MRAAWLIFVVLLVTGCASHHEQNTPAATEGTARVMPAHAQCFFLDKNGTERTLHMRENPSAAYFLSSVALPSCAGSSAQPQRLVVLGAPYIGYLNALGLQDWIVAVDAKSNVYDETLRSRIDSGLVAQVGMVGAMDTEAVVGLAPDWVIYSSAGMATEAQVAKLQDAGLRTLQVSEWRESHPLGRMEWVKVFGALLCVEDQADSVYRAVAKQYQAAKDNSTNTPVSVLTGAPYQGVWYAPTGPSFLREIVADAGGHLVWKSQAAPGAEPYDVEAVFSTARNADLWLNPGTATTMSALKAVHPLLGQFGAAQAGRVYNATKHQRADGASLYFQQSAVRPDLLLQDLKKIIAGQPQAEQLLYYEALGR